MMNSLSFRARAVIDELIAQLKCRGEALQGVEITIIEKDLTYRRGKFIVKKSREERRTLGGEQVLADLIDPLDFFDESKFLLKELSGGRQNEVRLRARSVEEQKSEVGGPLGDIALTMTLIISRAPVRLLRAEAKMINVPRWFKWVIKSVEASVEFDYIRRVPVPKKSIGRMLSRGIGPWRWGTGNDWEIRYDKL